MWLPEQLLYQHPQHFSHVSSKPSLIFSITKSKLIPVHQPPSGDKLHRHFGYIGSEASRCESCTEDLGPPRCVNLLDPESSDSLTRGRTTVHLGPLSAFHHHPTQQSHNRILEGSANPSPFPPLRERKSQSGVTSIIHGPLSASSRTSSRPLLLSSIFLTSDLNKVRLGSPDIATLC